MERTVLLENGPVLDSPQLKIAPRSRPASEATLGQRIDEYLTAPIPATGIPFEPITEEIERALIMRASYATKWNQSRTAELLNLKRDKLRYRMKLYDIRSGRSEPETNDAGSENDEAAA